MKAGILLNKNGCWIGAHYSPYNKRWCINVLPCVTLWITKKGGNVPDKCKIYGKSTSEQSVVSSNARTA